MSQQQPEAPRQLERERVAVRAYIARQRPQTPISLGVITNPFSRTNARSRLHDRFIPHILPDPNNAVHTRTIDDLDRALERLLLRRGVNVLGLNGGDGTLHLGVNRLLALSRRVERRTGIPFPLPRLLFLNGGTLNIVSRATGTTGNPARTIRDFVRRARGARLADLAVRRLGMLEVTPDEGERRYGFVFGSEVVANALEMYTLFGEGYTGLARFLAEVGLGYTLHTRLWQEHGWKLDAPRTPLELDSILYPRYLAVVGATIDLSILKGALTALQVPEKAQGFEAKIMLETSHGKIIRTIPKLLVGASHPSVKDIHEAGSLRMTGGYTLDGEVFLDRSLRGSRRQLTVQRAAIELLAVRAHA